MGRSSLKRHPWLLDVLLGRRDGSSPETADVLQFVQAVGDGSEVKLISDGFHSIHAVFTAQSMTSLFMQSSSEDSPQNWNRSTIRVMKYRPHVQLRESLEKSEFVLIIEEFSIWRLLEGFRHKFEPEYCLHDRSIRQKLSELWHSRNSPDPTQSSVVDDMMTSLLAEMAMPSPSQPTADSVEESNSNTGWAGMSSDFSVDDFIIPPDQLALLSQIPDSTAWHPSLLSSESDSSQSQSLAPSMLEADNFPQQALSSNANVDTSHSHLPLGRPVVSIGAGSSRLGSPSKREAASESRPAVELTSCSSLTSCISDDPISDSGHLQMEHRALLMRGTQTPTKSKSSTSVQVGDSLPLHDSPSSPTTADMSVQVGCSLAFNYEESQIEKAPEPSLSGEKSSGSSASKDLFTDSSGKEATPSNPGATIEGSVSVEKTPSATHTPVVSDNIPELLLSSQEHSDLTTVASVPDKTPRKSVGLFGRLMNFLPSILHAPTISDESSSPDLPFSTPPLPVSTQEEGTQDLHLYMSMTPGETQNQVLSDQDSATASCSLNNAIPGVVTRRSSVSGNAAQPSPTSTRGSHSPYNLRSSTPVTSQQSSTARDTNSPSQANRSLTNTKRVSSATPPRISSKTSPLQSKENCSVTSAKDGRQLNMPNLDKTLSTKKQSLNISNLPTFPPGAVISPLRAQKSHSPSTSSSTPLTSNMKSTSSTPASITPASITPASITPASITPASITPASITPASITPVRSRSPTLISSGSTPSPTTSTTTSPSPSVTNSPLLFKTPLNNQPSSSRRTSTMSPHSGSRQNMPSSAFHASITSISSESRSTSSTTDNSDVISLSPVMRAPNQLSLLESTAPNEGPGCLETTGRESVLPGVTNTPNSSIIHTATQHGRPISFPKFSLSPVKLHEELPREDISSVHSKSQNTCSPEPRSHSAEDLDIVDVTKNQVQRRKSLNQSGSHEMSKVVEMNTTPCVSSEASSVGALSSGVSLQCGQRHTAGKHPVVLVTSSDSESMLDDERCCNTSESSSSHSVTSVAAPSAGDVDSHEGDSQQLLSLAQLAEASVENNGSVINLRRRVSVEGRGLCDSFVSDSCDEDSDHEECLLYMPVLAQHPRESRRRSRSKRRVVDLSNSDVSHSVPDQNHEQMKKSSPSPDTITIEIMPEDGTLSMNKSFVSYHHAEESLCNKATNEASSSNISPNLFVDDVRTKDPTRNESLNDSSSIHSSPNLFADFPPDAATLSPAIACSKPDSSSFNITSPSFDAFLKSLPKPMVVLKRLTPSGTKRPLSVKPVNSTKESSVKKIKLRVIPKTRSRSETRTPLKRLIDASSDDDWAPLKKPEKTARTKKNTPIKKRTKTRSHKAKPQYDANVLFYSSPKPEREVKPREGGHGRAKRKLHPEHVFYDIPVSPEKTTRKTRLKNR